MHGDYLIGLLLKIDVSEICTRDEFYFLKV